MKNWKKTMGQTKMQKNYQPSVPQRSSYEVEISKRS